MSDLNDSNEPFVITQRGRATAVLISADRYEEIENDLKLLDELELLQMTEEAKIEIENGKTLSHEEVKKRLNFEK